VRLGTGGQARELEADPTARTEEDRRDDDREKNSCQPLHGGKVNQPGKLQRGNEEIFDRNKPETENELFITEVSTDKIAAENSLRQDRQN